MGPPYTKFAVCCKNYAPPQPFPAGAHGCSAGRNMMVVMLLFPLVMAGLDPAIHVFTAEFAGCVDARDIGERKRRRSSNGYARA